MKRTTPIRPASIDIDSDPGLSTFSPKVTQPVILPTGTTTTGTATTESHSVQIIKNIYTVNPPGGANGEVQFNFGGSYTGDGGLTYVPSTDTLTTGTLNVTQLNPTRINLSSISNLTISGGSYNNVLKTDGAGTLSWASAFPSDAGNTGKFLKSNGINQEWANVSYANLVDIPGNIATTDYVGNAIANLVDSSPAALNTLNELANALGNNASFSTTITNQLANKASVTSVTDLGNTVANITWANLSGAPTIPTDIANLTDLTSLLGGGSSFDQDLNTTDDVEFANLTVTGKVIAKQDTGTDGGYSFGGDEGGNDTGMFSASDGVLDFYSNNQKIVTLNTDGVEFSKDVTISSGQSLYTQTTYFGNSSISEQEGIANRWDIVLDAESNVIIKTNEGSYQWTFGNDGNITLPLGGDILDSTGNSVLGGAGGNPFDQNLNTTDSPRFDDIEIHGNIIANSSIDMYSINGGEIDIYTDWDSGNGVEVWLKHDDGIHLTTQNGQFAWQFNRDGSLTLPTFTNDWTACTTPNLSGGITFATTSLDEGPHGTTRSATINLDRTSLLVNVSSSAWSFDTTGNITLPAGGDILDSTGNSVLGGGSSFDQDLNTSNNVSFGSVTTGNIFNDGTIEITTPYGTNADIDIYTDWAGNGSSGGIDLWLKHGDALYIKTHDGDHVWSFDDNGILNLPASGDIRDSTGNSVLGGGVSTTLDNSSVGDMDVMIYDGNIKYTSNVTIDASSGNLKAKLFIGNIKLPAGGDIVDSTGNSVLGGGGGASSLAELDDVQLEGPVEGSVLTWNASAEKWENRTPSGGGGGGIALTDISVGADNSANGGGNVSYNNSTGVFTYTPPDLSSYVTSITNIFDQDLNTSNNVTFANLEVNGKIEQNLTYTKGRNYLGISSGTTSDIWTADSDTITSVKLTVQIESRTGSPYYENFDTMTCEIVMAKKRNGGTYTAAPITVYGIVHTSENPLATFSSYIITTPGPDLGKAVLTCTPDASITTTSYVRVHSVEMFSPSVQDDF